MNGASQELQDVAMASLLKYPEILSKALTELQESFFTNSSYWLIYKCLKRFYEKNLVLPSKVELILEVKRSHTDEYGDIQTIAKDLDYLYSQQMASEDYAFDTVATFIRRCKGEIALTKLAKSIRGKDISKELDLDTALEDMSSALTLNFTRTTVHNLASVEDLTAMKQEALGDTCNPVIIKFFIEELNFAMQYKGLIPGTLTAIVGSPGKGKSTLLINQGVSIAQQGFNLLHIFLGDMTKFDGTIRYLSCFSGVPTSKLVELSDEKLADFIRKNNMTGFLSKIDILSYAADQLTANQLIEEISTIQKRGNKHYDAIIVDYDENISYEGDDMYKSGGAVYNKLALFSRQNKSVVFIASQPKPEYWGNEIIPLESLSESSKKQKIVDMILTLGRPFKQSSIGTLYIAKNRRGEENKIYRVEVNGANAKIVHISDNDYERRKQLEKNGSGNK